jgi:hypothetical protein
VRPRDCQVAGEQKRIDGSPHEHCCSCSRPVLARCRCHGPDRLDLEGWRRAPTSGATGLAWPATPSTALSDRLWRPLGQIAAAPRRQCALLAVSSKSDRAFTSSLPNRLRRARAYRRRRNWRRLHVTASELHWCPRQPRALSGADEVPIRLVRPMPNVFFHQRYPPKITYRSGRFRTLWPTSKTRSCWVRYSVVRSRPGGWQGSPQPFAPCMTTRALYLTGQEPNFTAVAIRGPIHGG